MRRMLSFIVALTIIAGCFFTHSAIAESMDFGNNVMVELSDQQRNSIGVLNYLAYLTKEIESQKNNRLYLEDAYSSLYNNTYMNAIDSITLGQVKSLLTALHNFKMLATKRQRLEYIHEQNQAQAIKEAIPDPMSVMNVVLSGSWQKALVSVIDMAVNSAASYYASKQAADMQYLQDGWELDDEETEILHNGHLESFEYMWEIVQDYNLPSELAITENDIDRFVSWKSNNNLAARLQYLESNKEVYQGFGEYWLTLAESYYEHGDLAKCLDSIASYETYSTRIFRKDYHYAKVLPMAITAASSEYDKEQYVTAVSRFASRIVSNCDQEDWALRYFAAVAFVELAGISSDVKYLEMAYDIVLNNVNSLVQEQIKNNKVYLAEVQLEKVKAGTPEAKKKEIETYNKGLQETRKTALPPVSDALMLNCDLLFSLAEQLKIGETEKERIDSILYGHKDALFLNPFIDSLYRFYGYGPISTLDIEVAFDGETIQIPAQYLSERSTISVGGLDPSGKPFLLDDWKIKSVERKNTSDLGSYTATFTSEDADSFDYIENSTVWINLNPTGDDHFKDIQLSFLVTSKTDFIFPYTVFQRID